MKNTIKAKKGYKVVKIKDEQRDNMCLLKDGDERIMLAELRSYKDYIDECKNGNDETAEKMEVFTTEKSNQFIYWRSNEIDADYLTKVSA